MEMVRVDWRHLVLAVLILAAVALIPQLAGR
jgi:hypothetical protein